MGSSRSCVAFRRNMDGGRQRRKGLEVLAILLVVIAGYVIAPERLPLYGEETTRAIHGIEMAASGDWLRATMQGEPILDRPPLQYWLLALVHAHVHPLDPLTVRYVAAAITLATALLLWLYASRFLGAVGACTAACAFATMGHISELGRRIETDGLFTLLLAAAMLAWHAGYAAGRAPWRYWLPGGVLAGLAALTKGTQAPLAFFGTAYAYLAWKRNGAALRAPGQLAGYAAFAAVVAVWQIPFWLQEGWAGTRMTWFDPGAQRYDAGLGRWIAHLVQFPLALFVSELPWSLLLLPVLGGRWRALATLQARDVATYALIGSASILVPVWLTAHGAPRHAMPVHPLLALVIGVVAEQLFAASAQSRLARYWHAYHVGLSWLLLVAAIVLVAVTVLHPWVGPARLQELAQPWLLLVLLVAGAVACIALRGRRTLPSLFALALLLACWLNGPALNTVAASAERLEPQVEAFRASLPPGEQLVSFGKLNHKFLYYYDVPVPRLPWPERADEVPADVEWFGFHAVRGWRYELPFAWQEVARFNVERRRKDNPDEYVVIGRRAPTANGAGR